MNDEILICRSITENWWKFDSLICEMFPDLVDIGGEDYLYVAPNYQISLSSIYHIRINLVEGSVTLLDAQNEELYKDKVKQCVSH